MDLVEFLRARIDEDEQVAGGALGGPWIAGFEQERLVDTVIYGQSTWPGHLGQVCNVDYSHEKRGSAEHIARWDPARVLAEVAAKRALLDAHGVLGHLPCDAHDGATCETEHCAIVLMLALPYADHSDYQQDWSLDG